MKVVQLNCRKSRLVLDNLITQGEEFDLALLQEPPRAFDKGILKQFNYYSAKSTKVRASLLVKKSVKFWFDSQFSDPDAATGWILDGNKELGVSSLYLDILNEGKKLMPGPVLDFFCQM